MKSDSTTSIESSGQETQKILIQSTADIVTALVNSGQKGDVKKFIRDVYQELASLSGTTLQGGDEAPSKRPAPKVSIKESVQADYIVCLEDGKKLKMLKRYLKTHYDMTPEDYRKRWNLPADYPMVAPNYAKKRSQLAHKIGLGKKRATGSKRTRATNTRKQASK